MTIQATKKLQDFLGIREGNLPDESIDPIYLWHGNLFKIGHKKCLLLTHNESYYSIFLYGITKKDITNIPELARAHLLRLMRKDSFSPVAVDQMIQSMKKVGYTKTSNRSVQGVMNNMIQTLQYYNMTEDLFYLTQKLNHTPYKANKFTFPVEALKHLLLSRTMKNMGDPIPPLQKQLAIKQITHYCNMRIPEHARDQIVLKYDLAGDTIILIESSLKWDDETQWIDMPIAKMTYDKYVMKWLLYCMLGNGQWIYYEGLEPQVEMKSCLDEIDSDPTCIFWG